MNLSKDLRRHRATLRALRALISEFPDEAWAQAPQPDAWSPAQVYSHISIIAEGFSFKNLEACLDGSAQLGGRKYLLGRIILWTNVIRGSRRVRVDFPPELLPRSLNKSEARAAMDALEARAEAFAPRVASADLRFTSKHFLLGWMNAAEWFRFAEIHHRHHLEGQLHRLLQGLAIEKRRF